MIVREMDRASLLILLCRSAIRKSKRPCKESENRKVHYQDTKWGINRGRYYKVHIFTDYCPNEDPRFTFLDTFRPGFPILVRMLQIHCNFVRWPEIPSNRRRQEVSASSTGLEWWCPSPLVRFCENGL